MTWQFSVYMVIIGLSACVSLLLSYTTYRNVSKRTAPQVLGILLGIGIWAGADVVRVASTEPTVKLFAYDVGFLGSTVLVLSTFLFALEYTNRERYLTKRIVGALFAPFALTLALVWTEGVLNHGLVFDGYSLIRADGLVLMDPSWGPWSLVNLVYSYALLLGAQGMYLSEFVRVERGTAYRRQLALLLVAMVVPWVASGLYVTGVTAVGLTSALFLVTGLIFYALLFWFDLLDLVPIARSTVIDNMDEGFMVIGEDGRIADANKSMAALVGTSRTALLGRTIEEVESEHPELADALGGKPGTGGDLTMDRDGETRQFAVELSPVYAENDRYLGRVVLVRDVTEDRRREERLRRQAEQLRRHNERLDQFTNIVSHDLRNPLTVAKGYLELERDQRRSTDNLEAVDDSLDRMEEIIGDVLTLARQTSSSIETEPVELADVARKAWEIVDTRNGDLRIDSSGQLEVDPGHLRQLFENLFRNAFDHGGDEVTVSVGSTAGGFYVEDDGPGIDEDDREEIFEEGYTTSEGGTGFGLAIVSAITESHGWSVSATAATNGGARFEVTDVGDSSGESAREAAHETT